MASFKVIKIVNANTIQVSPGWTWQNVNGSLVKIKGYKASSQEFNSMAIHRLNFLLLNKNVDLKNATELIDSSEGKAIHCSVYLNEVDISQYFPELRG